jgi:hypothetical protein
VLDAASRLLGLAGRLIAIAFRASALTAIAARLLLPGNSMQQSLGCNLSGRGVAVIQTECRSFPGADGIALVANLWMVPLVAIVLGFSGMLVGVPIVLAGLLALVLVGLGTVGLCGDIGWLVRRLIGNMSGR